MTEIIPKNHSSNPVKTLLVEEIMSMLKHLSSEGKSIPKLAEKIIDCEGEIVTDYNLSSNEILLLHKQLSNKIQPAKPKTILLLYKESKKGKWLKFLGPVSLVRSLMATTLISLIIFIGVGLSPQVDAKNLSEGILNGSGLNLL